MWLWACLIHWPHPWPPIIHRFHHLFSVFHAPPVFTSSLPIIHHIIAPLCPLITSLPLFPFAVLTWQNPSSADPLLRLLWALPERLNVAGGEHTSMPLAFLCIDSHRPQGGFSTYFGSPVVLFLRSLASLPPILTLSCWLCFLFNWGNRSNLKGLSSPSPPDIESAVVCTRAVRLPRRGPAWRMHVPV